MRLLDRYIVRSFLFNYLLAFAVLVGMYTLLDLIIHFDRFTKATGVTAGDGKHIASGLPMFISLMADILDFYGYRILVVFQQVSAAIPLLAAGFTMVRMTRFNELTAMLASGVSLYRVATPIFLCSVFFSLLVVVDQEFLMPACMDKLLREPDEVALPPTRTDPLFFVHDPKDNSLLSASEYDPVAKRLKDVRIIRRAANGTPTGRTMAPVAVWDADYRFAKDVDGKWILGAWKLSDARLIDDTPGADPSSRVAEKVESQFYYRTTLTPQQLDLVYSKKAVEYLSTSQIRALMQDSPDVTKEALEKMMHLRFTQPIMNLVLLLMGIPFLLTREPRQLIKNMIYCTIVTGICFVTTFVMFQATGELIRPIVIGAWLPVLVFGPISLAMLDTIKT